MSNINQNHTADSVSFDTIISFGSETNPIDGSPSISPESLLHPDGDEKFYYDITLEIIEYRNEQQTFLNI